MKLTFWHIQCEHDSSAYSIRTTTKTEALQRYQADEWNQYSHILERITLEYNNTFELFDSVLGEDSWHCLVADRREYKMTIHGDNSITTRKVLS